MHAHHIYVHACVCIHRDNVLLVARDSDAGRARKEICAQNMKVKLSKSN